MKDNILNILIGLDQFVQVIIYLGSYPPDETISGVIGYKIKNNRANFVEKSLCRVLRYFNSRHCIKAIDKEEWR